jgi:hypothetical protein
MQEQKHLLTSVALAAILMLISSLRCQANDEQLPQILQSRQTGLDQAI